MSKYMYIFLSISFPKFRQKIRGNLLFIFSENIFVFFFAKKINKSAPTGDKEHYQHAINRFSVILLTMAKME